MPESDVEAADDLAVQGARRGDGDSFRVLVERHGRAVYRLAFRITGNEIDAEDMVQETFLRAWKQIGRFDGRASLGTWLHRICANCALDHLRARKRKQEFQAAPDDDGSDFMVRVATEAPSPERLAFNSQLTSILGTALNDLSEMERVAFVMRHYEGFGIEEIALTLGVQPGAAKHSVFRAVQKLRRVLEPAMSATR